MKASKLFPCLILFIIFIFVTTAMRPLAPLAPLSATIDVDIFIDEFNDTNTGCSLREAVQSANNNANFGGCTGVGAYGHDVINLGTGTYLVSRGSGPTIAEDANVYGDLDISPSEGGIFGYDITINGNGPENTIIDAQNKDRVIDIQDNTRLKLVGVKIYQGNPSDYDGKVSNGSGIFNHGTLYIENSLFEKNSGAFNDELISVHIGDGGAIWSDGRLTILNSTFFDNRASVAANSEDGGDGGAIYIAATSVTVLIQNSTFYSNSAGRIYEPGDGTGGRGGAIFNAGDDTWIETSTLDFNLGGQASSATSNGGDGGGIYNQGRITITNCTIYNNRTGSSDHAASGSGGGVVNSGGEMDLNESTIASNAVGTGVTYGSGGGIESIADNTTTRLHNTLVAYNMNPGPPEGSQIKDCHTGPATSNNFEGRFSLIYSLNGCVLDVSQSMQLGSYPGMGEYGYHGGVTQTISLISGSMAIDTGDPTSCPATDQRGFGRPADGDHTGSPVCDIGAFEVQLPFFLPLIKK